MIAKPILDRAAEKGKVAVRRLKKPSMSTVLNNSRTWRAAALVLVLIAIFGPWTYERVYMPPSVRCPLFNAHIEGDVYCGIPLSILWELFGLLRLDATAALFAGEIDLAQWAPQFLYKMMTLLLIMPILTTLGLLSRGLRSRWQVINLLAWALAALAGGAYLRRGFFRPYAAPWGNLLFVAAALAALILELLALIHSRSHTLGDPPAPRPSNAHSKP